jgi:hypothetical protein
MLAPCDRAVAMRQSQNLSIDRAEDEVPVREPMLWSTALRGKSAATTNSLVIKIPPLPTHIKRQVSNI